MRLSYEAPGVRLYLGDCREAASVLGGQLFTLILADPPYEQTSLAWDTWPEGWLQAARGWRAENGSLWCWGTLRLFMQRAEEFTASGWKLAQDTVWEKHNGSQPGGDRFLRVHEQAAHFYPEGVRWRDIYHEPQRVPAPPEHAHKAGRVVHRKAQPAHTGKHKPSTYVDTGQRRQRSVWHVRSMHRQGGQCDTEAFRGAGADHSLLVPAGRLGVGALRRRGRGSGCSAAPGPERGRLRRQRGGADKGCEAAESGYNPYRGMRRAPCRRTYRSP